MIISRCFCRCNLLVHSPVEGDSSLSQCADTVHVLGVSKRIFSKYERLQYSGILQSWDSFQGKSLFFYKKNDFSPKVHQCDMTKDKYANSFSSGFIFTVLFWG